MFFGCRKKEEDFLYREELEENSFPFSLSLAFSRDQKEKIYVQNRLKEKEKEVWDRLKDNNGVIYICGDGKETKEERKERVTKMQKGRKWLQMCMPQLLAFMKNFPT